VTARAGHSSFARRGPSFTLVEAVISIAVVAVMLTAALSAAGAAKLAQLRTAHAGRAALLAEALMAEILRQDYAEPTDAPAFGREVGEEAGCRSAYDDVDDYAGWSASPPESKNGQPLAGVSGWRRAVAVARVDPSDLASVVTTDSGVKRITVSASYRGAALARLVALRTEACDAEEGG
jgi:Tfp pilus assembly protein PilV